MTEDKEPPKKRPAVVELSNVEGFRIGSITSIGNPHLLKADQVKDGHVGSMTSISDEHESAPQTTTSRNSTWVKPVLISVAAGLILLVIGGIVRQFFPGLFP